MNLNLRRTVFTQHSTIGPLSINQAHECFIMELPWRENKRDISCIPIGRYKIHLAFSPMRKYVVPLLRDVPERDAIEIHVGNFPKDTHGCLLPGLTVGADFVGRSADAFALLRLRIAQGTDEPEGCWITIQ